jgi:transposase
MRYELTDYEWVAIKPFLPNKPRGVQRANDRRVLNGIFWVLRSGAPWRDLPGNFGPYTTCYNRFVRWRRAGVWDQLMNALTAGHDAAVQMIDTSVVRVHQHGACIAGNNEQLMGRSRGGLTTKIHAVVDTSGLPVRLALTTGEAHDNRLVLTLLSGLRSGAMLLADRGFDADWIRALVSQYGAWANIPPRRNRTEVGVGRPFWSQDRSTTMIIEFPRGQKRPIDRGASSSTSNEEPPPNDNAVYPYPWLVLDGLPFVGPATPPRPNGCGRLKRNCWNDKPTESGINDYARGRRYARMMLAAMKANSAAGDGHKAQTV